MGARRYRYVGPDSVRIAALSGDDGCPIGGCPIGSLEDFERWVMEQAPRDLAEPFTFAVGLDGLMRVAPRRSEHVACAGGGDVLAAGEIRFSVDRRGWLVREVSNQSTGYCPDVDSWDAVAAALETAGLDRPDGFTEVLIFRRCPGCGERNVVRDGDFTCAVCGAMLPAEWNFGAVHDR